VSLCIRATCLPHRREMYVWLTSGAPYPWVHADGWPCAAQLPLTAEEAEEVCACGHEPHAAPPGLPVWPRSEKDRPCLLCDCPDFRHRWQADRREAAA
jgi:hypothetical protein